MKFWHPTPDAGKNKMPEHLTHRTSMLDRITRWMDMLERLVTAVTAMMLGLVAVLVGWQVVARYVFHSGQFWADELTLLAIMWATMLGAAACVWTDSHVSLTYLVSRLPKGPRVLVLTVLDLIILGFSLLLVSEGVTLVLRTMGGKKPALNISVGTTYIILPAAGILMALFVIVKATRRIAGTFSGTRGGP